MSKFEEHLDGLLHTICHLRSRTSLYLMVIVCESFLLIILSAALMRVAIDCR